MGTKISCNIQKIEDERGLITALGQDNMSKIQKDASIAKAKAVPSVQAAIEGKNIVKEIYVKGRILNIVVK